MAALTPWMKVDPRLAGMTVTKRRRARKMKPINTQKAIKEVERIMEAPRKVQTDVTGFLRALKAIKSSYDSDLDLFGEDFTRKELEHIKKIGQYGMNQCYSSTYRYKYYSGFNLTKTHHGSPWKRYAKIGAMVGGKFRGYQDIEQEIRRSLKAKMDSVLIRIGDQEVVIDYQRIKGICEVWKGKVCTMQISTVDTLVLQIGTNRSVFYNLASQRKNIGTFDWNEVECKGVN